MAPHGVVGWNETHQGPSCPVPRQSGGDAAWHSMIQGWLPQRWAPGSRGPQGEYWERRSQGKIHLMEYNRDIGCITWHGRKSWLSTRKWGEVVVVWYSVYQSKWIKVKIYTVNPHQQKGAVSIAWGDWAVDVFCLSLLLLYTGVKPCTDQACYKMNEEGHRGNK